VNPYTKEKYFTMSENEKREISDEAKEELAKLFRVWSRKDESWEGVYDDHESALEIVDRNIAAGWVPKDA
jgi:hypothetical protein